MRCGALAWMLTEMYVEMDVFADVSLRSSPVSGFGCLMRGGALACRLRIDAMVEALFAFHHGKVRPWAEIPVDCFGAL